MMNTNQRNIRSKTDSFSLSHAHQKSTNQPRAIGDTDGIQIFQSYSSLFQSFFNNSIDSLDMFSGGDLRHYTAVFLMNIDLRRDHIRQNSPSVLDHCRSRLITGTFQSQNQYIFIHNFTFFYSSSNVRVILFPSFPRYVSGKILRTSSR